MPYSSSFEVADLGAGLFLFDHSTWGWKYLDNDGDGESLSVGNDFSNLPAYDGSMQVYGSLNGSTIGIGAENETAQTPELSLTGGTAYGFSVYARTAFNQTGSIEMQISTDNGSYINTIGTASLSGADSTYTKYSFSLVAPSTQDDYVVNLNKTATGFIILDLFEIVELQQPTATITVNSSSTDEPGVEYCDSTVTVNFSSAGNPETLSLDWGDGTVEDVTGLTSATHTYASFGSYTIQISATNVVGTGTADAALSFTALPAPTVTFGAPAITDLTVAVTIGSSVGSNVVFTPECSRIIVDWGDGTIDEVTGSSSTSHTYGGEGTYTITVTVIGSGQESASQDVTLTGPSSINEISFEDAVSIYPNPSNEIVNVSFALVLAENIELAIYAVDGKAVDVRSFSNVKEVNTSFNTATLNNGVYVMKITSDNGVTAQKFVVSHN
jgi:PKD repeat protein